jgi:gliding motility-associated-like protein
MNKKKLTQLLLCCALLLCGRAHAQLAAGFDAVITHGDSLPWSYPSIPNAKIIRIGNPVGSGLPTLAGATAANIGNSSVPQPPNWRYLDPIFGVTIDNIGNVYFAGSSILLGLNFTLASSSIPAMASATTAVYKAPNASLNSIGPLCTFGTGAGVNTIGSTVFKSNNYGFGNICNHLVSGRLYTSNLDDGKIYEVNSTTGDITDIFDPFGSDPGSSDIAAPGELIVGLGINQEPDNTFRLYYARHAAANSNEIWSVRVNLLGGFVASDNTLEIVVRPLANNYTVITDVTFSKNGYMAFSERANNPHNVSTLEAYGHHNAWSIPKQLVVGNFGTGMNANGGVTYASHYIGNTMVCDSNIWTTCNAMNYQVAGTYGALYGGHSIPSNRLSTTPNIVSQAYVYDNNASDTDQTKTKAQFGDIEFFDSCIGFSPIDVCGLIGVSSQTDTNCCAEITLSNNFNANYFTGVNIYSPVLNISSVASGSWGTLSQLSPNTAQLTNGGAVLTGQANIPTGFTTIGNICYSGQSSGPVYLYWIGNAPQYDTVCIDTINVQCGQAPKVSCLSVEQDSIVCDNGAIVWFVKFTNNDTKPINTVTLLNQNPDIDAAFNYYVAGEPGYPTGTLLPGQTSGWIAIPLIVNNNAINGCFILNGCFATTIVNDTVLGSSHCCVDTNKYCVTIPQCPGGPGGCIDKIDVQWKSGPGGNGCCLSMDIINNYLASPITELHLLAINATSFLSTTTSWAVMPGASSSIRRFRAPGTGVGVGTIPAVVDMCVTGTTPPYQVLATYITADGKVHCSDTITFSQCTPDSPQCGIIVRDSMYCENTKTYYTFSVLNNGTNQIGQIDINTDKPTKFTVTPQFVYPLPFIAPGGVGGPYTVEVDTANGGDPNVCFYLSCHNSSYLSTTPPNYCCTDSLHPRCYPYLNCKIDGCCEFDKMTIPNGITPNGDSKNDKWVIIAPALCDSINIVVMNRWGNKVYEDKNYLNNWGGTNQAGALLPQGTYFVVITLPSGSQKGMYIDIRY